MPEGGRARLQEYLQREAASVNVDATGIVRLSFRVTEKSGLTDFKVVRSVSKEADAIAQQILKDGPRWIPAKEHGQEKIEGFAFAEIEFK